MAYNHWFVSRQKRKLTTILEALVTYSDICVGEVWKGNTELQLKFEDELYKREITNHGSLRSRKEKQGGGGIRTLFKQLKDLGLVFTEDDNGKCRLTLIGEEIVRGNITFVEAMRIQLQRYQYPSAACYTGSGAVDHSIKVHPFQFMFRLLIDERLDGMITMDEMSGVIIHYATSDSSDVYEDVVKRILSYRKGNEDGFIKDTDKKTYNNIANTFFNYISLTQYLDRGNKTLIARKDRIENIKDFIEEDAKFITHPELSENYLRKYGRGLVAKDLRNFDKDNQLSAKEISEGRIRREYVLLGLKTPITGITKDIIKHISDRTGIDDTSVERYLVQNYPHGNIDDFFLSYKELAHMGTSGATDFEIATCEMFNKIFNMKAKHVGPIGNTPDVFVESESGAFCGIIDNKAYKNGYSISGDHKRVMEDVYIPEYKKYGKTELPLAFFSYIAGSFGKNINSQLIEINKDTGINGSAMPVDLFIDMAENYAKNNKDHNYLKKIFSVNREVRIEDIEG